MAAVLQLLAFPAQLHLRLQTLGAKTPVLIGGAQGKLCLPRLPSWDEAVLKTLPWLSRPAVVGASRIQAQRLSNWGDIEWGRVWSCNPKNKTGAARIGFALLRFESTLSDEDTLHGFGTSVEADLDRWYQTVTDWLEVLTGQDLDHRHPVQHVSGGSRCGTGIWYARLTDGAYLSVAVNPTFQVQIDDDESAATPGQWRCAIAAGNGKREVPGGHLLLRDAARALRRAEYRRAILDAATAADLSLVSLVRGGLEKRNEPWVVERVLKQNWQLGNLIQLAAGLGLAIPNNVKDGLVELRNKVIHVNRAVQRDEAVEAVRLSRVVVRLETPLPRVARNM